VNLILLDPTAVQSGAATLTGRAARHVAEVLRSAAGDTLRVGVVQGPTGRAMVTSCAVDRVDLAVTLDGPPPDRPPVDLLLALPRPKVLRRTLELAAAAGVGSLALVNSWRVDRSYFATPFLLPERIQETLRLGCEQGGHTWVPEVSVHPRLMPVLDALPPPAPGERRLVAHPGAALLEAAFPPGTADRCLVAVGPEGGFIAREVETFERLGFTPVGLDRAILRVEHAVAALLAQLSLLRRLPGGNSGR
jgi:RsmE family RNA methyltransferase